MRQHHFNAKHKQNTTKKSSTAAHLRILNHWLTILPLFLQIREQVRHDQRIVLIPWATQGATLFRKQVLEHLHSIPTISMLCATASTSLQSHNINLNPKVL